MATTPVWNSENGPPHPDGAQSAAYRFGPYRLTTVDRLLRRENEVVSLPPRVVDTLLVLVEAQGELVTKETLQERVWGDVYVDPNSITQNISRLRRTLDPDFAESTIATLPKRGYRFVAEVTKDLPKERASSVAAEAVAVPAEAVVMPFVLPAVEVVAPKKARRWPMLVAVLVVAALAGWGGWRAAHEKLASTPTVRQSVAILGFDDLSGDPRAKTAWIGTALAETLYSEIGADPNIRLVSNDSVAAMRRSLKLDRATNLSPEDQASVRRILGCDLVVKGHYLTSDGHLRVDVVLEDARTGETVGTFSHTDEANQLLRVISASGQDLRARLGMPQLTGSQASTLQASLESEPQALQAYAEGVLRLRALDAAGAKPFLEQAIALEPNNPLSHAALADAWARLGYDSNAAIEAKKAFDLSGNLSHEEQLEVKERYTTVSAKWDETVAASRELFRLYPDNVQYGLDLSRVLNLAGKPRESLVVAAQLRKLPEPTKGDPRIALAEATAYTTLGDFTNALPRAQAAVAAARERNATFVLADALLAEGDVIDRMGRHEEARARFAEAKALAAGQEDRAFVARVLRKDAEAAREMGDLDTARTELTDAIATAREIGDRRDVIASLASLTQVYRALGDLPMQKQLTLEALQIAHEIGDRVEQTRLQIDLGNELNNMGDPEGGKQAYLKGLALARELGDSRTESRALGNLGIIEYTHGNLQAGQNYIEQGLAVSRKMGESSSVAYKLGHYASVLMYQGKLKEAKAALDERCGLLQKAGEKIDIGSCKLAQAELQGKQGDQRAEIAQLEWITANYTTHTPALDAWEALARAKLNAGDLPGAKDALAHADEMGKKTVNEADFLIPIALIRGRLQTKMGQDGEAEKTLQAALGRAKALGLVPLELQARRALGELHMKRDKSRGSGELMAMAADADRLGFKPMAADARAAAGR
jgi:DNA-binding winged helix-turn-helix (wHTH) protein/tetratricopeptide (TPR) repeat protein/TolB-like protein